MRDVMVDWKMSTLCLGYITRILCFASSCTSTKACIDSCISAGTSMGIGIGMGTCTVRALLNVQPVLDAGHVRQAPLDGCLLIGFWRRAAVVHAYARRRRRRNKGGR